MKRLLWFACCLLICGEVLEAGQITCVPIPEDHVTKARNFWTIENRRVALPPLTDPISSPLLGLRGTSSAFSMSPSIASRFAFAKTSFPNPNLSTPPFKTAGRLHFRDLYYARDYCTASFTDDPFIIVTAAHCVRRLTVSGSAFLSDFLFTRVYEPNQLSPDDYDVVAVATVDEWVTRGSKRYRYDYAFLRLSPLKTTAVTPLTFVTTGAPKKWFAIGYPLSLGGETMKYVEGALVSNPSGIAEMDGNPMERGASGGPWIPPDTSGGIGTSVFAVGSRFVAGSSKYEGPEFDARTRELLDYVKAGCKKPEPRSP